MARPDNLSLGRVTKVHGLRGEVKVALYADAWTPFQRLTWCLVGPPGGPYRQMEVESSRAHGRAVVLKLGGIDAPDAAGALVGCDVAIRRADAPSLPEETFYHYDILGLDVVVGEETLGTVREIMEGPAHDVYVIRGPAGEWLLPATRVHILRVDLAAGRIELDPTADVAGLVEGGRAGGTAPESL